MRCRLPALSRGRFFLGIVLGMVRFLGEWGAVEEMRCVCCCGDLNCEFCRELDFVV